MEHSSARTRARRPTRSTTARADHEHEQRHRSRRDHQRSVLGIGEATARALAADGHRVALLARRADRVEALADELGNGAIAVEADVTDRDSVVAAAEGVQRELGGADIRVNNAGVMLLAPFSSRPEGSHAGSASGLAGRGPSPSPWSAWLG